MRKSKPRRNLLHGECVAPRGWDIETGPRLERIVAASMSRVRHGSRSANIFDEPGGWACGQAREALDKLHPRSADLDAAGKHHDHGKRPDRQSMAMEAFW